MLYRLVVVVVVVVVVVDVVVDVVECSVDENNERTTLRLQAANDFATSG